MREWRAAVEGYAESLPNGKRRGYGGRAWNGPRKASVERQIAELRAAGKLN